MYQNLVLSGGAFNSIMFVGALRLLEEQKYLDKIKYIIGSSAGAIIGLMVCLNISSANIEIFLKSEIDIYTDKNDFDVDSILDSFDTLGISDGKEFEEMIDRIFDSVNMDKKIQFIDFTKKTGKNFVVCVSNLTTGKSEYCCIENTPNCSVARAIRASISIPILMTPVVNLNESKNIYVDGGLFDNFPIEFFNTSKPFCDTLSLIVPMKLIASDIANLNIFTYTKQVFDALLYNHNVCKLDNVHKSNLIVYMDNPNNNEKESYNGIDMSNIGKILVSSKGCDLLIQHGYDELHRVLCDPLLKFG